MKHLSLCVLLFLLGPAGVIAAADLPPRTTLANPAVPFTVATKPYVVLKRGPIEAVVADHQAVDDTALPGHRKGYSGLGALRHTSQPRNLFVPAYAGLNFEHILDGTQQERAVLFEPRNVPVELRMINEHTVELYQAPTPHYAVESSQRFELRADGVIEMTFECIPRRVTWANGYLHFFWASYIDRPESLDIHFRGRPGEHPNGSMDWIRGVTPKHGELATHLGLADRRNFPHVEPFPLELPFGFSRHRFAEPWYFGFCRNMAFVQMFRPEDQVRLAQSPSGGGAGCPAWDFQWFIEKPKVGRRYQLVMRALYLPVKPDPLLAETRRDVEKATRPLLEIK